MEEMVEELQEQRNQLRQDAKRNIQKIQAENKRTYDRKRKKAPRPREEAGWSNRRIGRHLGRSDMVVARCWQQWITEGRVYHRGGVRTSPGTQMIARIVQSEEWPLRHQQRRPASIQRHLPPSRHPVSSRETIRRRLTEVGLRSRRPLRLLPLTPHHRQCRLDFCRPRATWSVTDWRRVSSSVMNPDSVSVLMTTAHVSGGAPASGPIRHLLSSGIQQFHKV
ncbi:HTH_Tnp_Tc3_2 domain-containing protein [Trichonephila clavipes]|nr:HTH_Tnp_Tc3_2 domain-containing protein [Trichonephila clavipes]